MLGIAVFELFDQKSQKSYLLGPLEGCLSNYLR